MREDNAMADKNIGITNMNGETHSDETTCSFQDMNCLGDTDKKADITNMNSVSDNEDTTCSLDNMNCN